MIIQWIASFIIISFIAFTYYKRYSITKNPDYAIIFSIMSDGLAAIPTVLKARKYSHIENVNSFIGGLFLACPVFLQ